MTSYRVTAPYVLLKHRGSDGANVVTGFYQGSIVPATIDPDNLQHHLDNNLVEEVPSDSPTVTTPPAAPDGDDQVPTGHAAVIKWVGTDRDRAQRALATENARPKPRPTVLSVLIPLTTTVEPPPPAGPDEDDITGDQPPTDPDPAE